MGSGGSVSTSNGDELNNGSLLSPIHKTLISNCEKLKAEIALTDSDRIEAEGLKAFKSHNNIIQIVTSRSKVCLLNFNRLIISLL